MFSLHFKYAGLRYHPTLEMVSSEKEILTEPQRQLDFGILGRAVDKRG